MSSILLGLDSIVLLIGLTRVFMTGAKTNHFCENFLELSRSSLPSKWVYKQSKCSFSLTIATSISLLSSRSTSTPWPSKQQPCSSSQTIGARHQKYWQNNPPSNRFQRKDIGWDWLSWLCGSSASQPTSDSSSKPRTSRREIGNFTFWS